MYGPYVAMLLMGASRNMRRIDFRGLTGSQRTPQVWGVLAWYQSLGLEYLGLDWARVRSCILCAF